jgi:hypothetical protein
MCFEQSEHLVRAGLTSLRSVLDVAVPEDLNNGFEFIHVIVESKCRWRLCQRHRPRSGGVSRIRSGDGNLRIQRTRGQKEQGGEKVDGIFDGLLTGSEDIQDECS